MFTYKRRVTFYETDGMKVVHHANYLKYFEEARVEYLRAGGLDLNELMEEGIVFPIVEVSVKYLKSACYDDTLLIRTYLAASIACGWTSIMRSCANPRASF